MSQNFFIRRIGQVYLSLVPVLTTILGMGIGHISYKIYLPVWIINVCLMITAAWILGFHSIRSNDEEKKHLAWSAFFLIVPWILVSMFAGLGPPPETAAGWVESATEQQVRYSMLVAAGVFIAFGFVGLSDRLKNIGESFYSRLGLTSLLIAIPLFAVNMLFWGFYLPELFKFQYAQASENFPDWFIPVRKQFGLISVVEVALTYVATIAFAVSFKKAGWFGKTASSIYIFLSLFAFLVITLSAFLPEPFITAGFVVSIPAIPFLMPYFMGINLLRRVGN